MSAEYQVEDNIGLLSTMMNDMEAAEALYKPTNYWSFYEKKFVPELKKKGLKDFRRREKSVLQSFGAIDLWAFAEPAYEGPIRVVNRLVKISYDFFKKLGLRLNLDYNPEGITRYYQQKVKEKFDKHGLDVSKCSMSKFGNPQDIVDVNGTFWSLAHLRHCSLYIDSYDYIQFKDDMVYCELGPGIGRSVESLAKLYKDATFILFDIPPQLYVSNQYLTAVFKNRVISYEEARKLDASDNIIDKIRGKIVILPTWFMPKWQNVNIDVFWNSASFSEMEPESVENYLKLVSNMNPKHIYVNAPPKGNTDGKRETGKGGNVNAVLEEYYVDFLKNKYKLKTKYFTDYFLVAPEYMSYVFERS